MQIGDGDDVRMSEALHEREVAADRLQLRLVVLHLRRQPLYGDIDIGNSVMREIDGPEPALAELAPKLVLVDAPERAGRPRQDRHVKVYFVKIQVHFLCY